MGSDSFDIDPVRAGNASLQVAGPLVVDIRQPRSLAYSTGRVRTVPTVDEMSAFHQRPPRHLGFAEPLRG